MLESDSRVVPRRDDLLFVDDDLTGEHYGKQKGWPVSGWDLLVLVVRAAPLEKSRLLL